MCATCERISALGSGARALVAASARTVATCSCAFVRRAMSSARSRACTSSGSSGMRREYVAKAPVSSFSRASRSWAIRRRSSLSAAGSRADSSLTSRTRTRSRTSSFASYTCSRTAAARSRRAGMSRQRSTRSRASRSPASSLRTASSWSSARSGLRSFSKRSLPILSFSWMGSPPAPVASWFSRRVARFSHRDCAT